MNDGSPTTVTPATEPVNLAQRRDDELRQLRHYWPHAGGKQPLVEQLADRIKTEPQTMHAWALHYASAGIPVFPCVPGEKRPACRNGFKDATLEQPQIDEWWTRNPDYNIAAPTGTHWDVVDVDPGGYLPLAETPGPGDGSIRDWIAAMALGTVSTPRGGLHWYIPTGFVTQGTAFLPNVDARAAGGYVLLPPSLVNGRRYTGTVPGAAA